MQWPDKVKAKLDALPDTPGVYIMRDRSGVVIYVGKAASLRSRVRHYFQQATLRSADPKLRGLIKSVADFDVLALRSESEATITESRFIKDYKPYYNVQQKDDKRFLLLRVNLNDPFPRFCTCRIRKNDGNAYFGPYASSAAAHTALDFIEKRFGIRHCRPRQPGPAEYKHCLNDIVRYCSCPCLEKISREDYLERVHLAASFLRGEKTEFLKEVDEQMKKAAAERNFEQAAALRDVLRMLREAVKTRIRAVKPEHIKAEEACRGVRELQTALNLDQEPRTIECYDISNIGGTNAVASQVCAVDGRPCKKRYRHYKIKTVFQSDDPAMMAEVIRRRLTRAIEEKTALPDLIVVDGGLTQVRAAVAIRNELRLDRPAIIGLAKRYEEIFTPDCAIDEPIRLAQDSAALLVLRQLRDEAHRFALTYHRKLRNQRIRESILDEISGIGEKKKQRLLQHFGSFARIQKASLNDLAAAPGIGPTFAQTIFEHLHPYQ